MHELYMAKLSQQFAEKEAEQQQGRETRSQRVAKQQALQRAELERQRFERLKAQAQEIQETKFKDKVVQETYTETIPKIYDVNDYTRRQWYKKEQYVRDRWMQNALRNKYRGDWAVNTYTRTRDKVIPFTLEDTGDQDYSYKDVYETLSPELKQFFDTPDVVLEKKAQRIDTTKQTVQEKLAEADKKIAERTAKYEQKKQELQDWWSNKSSKYRSDPKNRERRNERENDLEDDFEEDIAEIKGYKEGLNKGIQQLNQNKDVDFSSIENYAWDVANYEESKERARNEARSSFNEAKARGELDEAFKKLGLKENVGYSQFNQAVAKYNKDVAYKQSLVKWADKVGFDKISPQAQKILNPTLVDWQQKNPNEKLIFKGLDPIGVESGALQQSLSIENYQKVTSPDYIYNEWQKNNPPAPAPKQFDFKSGGFQSVNLDPFANIPKSNVPQFKVLTAGKELPLDYGSQQTAQFDMQGNIIPATQIMKTEDFLKIKNTPSNPIKDLWGGIKTGYNWANERVNWDFSLTGSPSFPKLSIISFGKKDTRVESYLNKGSEGVDKAQQSVEEWVIGKDNIEQFESGLETKYSNKYQSAFEQKYMKDLIYSNVDFDTASKEFAESKEAKAIQNQYQKEYGTGYKDLQIFTIKDDGLWKTAKADVLGGVAQFGLGIGELGVTAVKTPLNLGVTAGAIYTGTAVLGAIPPAITYAGLGALGVYGTYKFLDPESTYIEAGSGLVTAGLSFGTLGYAGYKYLKSPVVTTKAIKPPKASLKSSATKGYDVKIIKADGTEVNKVIYQNQKLSQTAQAGRRTIVTTKWRALSNKYLGTNLKNIYEGIPTASGGSYYQVQGLRGTYNVVRTPTDYQKALKLLTKYGWTDAQAKATLRYYAPRVTEQYLTKGELIIKGNKAIGGFETTTTRPVIDVDKALGIKTRGGGTTKDYTLVQRQLVKNAQGQNFVLENSVTKTYGVNLKGVKSFKQVQEQINLGIGKTSPTYKGLDAIKLNNKLTLYDQVTYKNVDIATRNLIKGTGSFNKNWVKLDLKIAPQGVDRSQTILIDKIIDLQKGNNLWIKPTGIKKTPFSKTFGSDAVDDIIREVTKETGTKTSNFNKVIEKLDDIGQGGYTPLKIERSQYYGTGQYEKTIGGLSPQQTQQLQTQLKSITIPDTKVMNIKNLIKINQFDKIGVGMEIGTLSAIKSAQGFKTDVALKSDLSVKNDLKFLLKDDLQFKQAQSPALKTSPALKSQLKTLLATSPLAPSLNTPVFRTPKIPDIKPPIPKPFILPFLKAEISKKTGKGKGRSDFERAYLPDFTSRALGLEAEIVSQKQAKKKLKQLLTGLEIRRGVKLR